VVLNDEPSADVPAGSGEGTSPDVREDESAAPGAERHAPPRLKGWHSEGEQGTEVEVASAAPDGGAVVEIPAAAQNQSPVAEIVPPVIEAVLPDPVPASSKRQTVILRGSGFGPGSRVTVGWTGRVKELAPEQVEVTSPEEMRIAIVTGRAADTWTVRVTNPDGASSRIVEFQVAPMKAELEASPAGSSAAGGEKAGLHREAWLLAQDPAHYTVQLMGAGKEADVLAFIEQHRLQGDLAYFRGVSQGKDWYSLVTGVYPDFKSANEAAARLAKRFGDVSPWVRQIAPPLHVAAPGRNGETQYRGVPASAWSGGRCGLFPDPPGGQGLVCIDLQQLPHQERGLGRAREVAERLAQASPVDAQFRQYPERARAIRVTP